MLAVVATASVVLLFTAAAQGQAPSRWVKLAPFPEPDEELYGVAANGKMYVLGGFAGGKMGRVYEYDPATDQWTPKKPMARPVHHQAMVEYRGKIYVFGGFVNQPVSGGLAGWEPVDNAWEYDPAADSWKALAPLPDKRGSAVAAEVGGKIYVIGGAIPQPNTKETGVYPNRPARATGTNQMYDPATNRWESRSPMPTARNHAFAGVVNGKIYVIGGRVGHSFISVASNTDVVEEYDPATDSWGAIKARMPTPRSGGGYTTYGGRIYTAGGELQTPQLLAGFRALEAYEPATNTWSILPAMPLPRHGVAAAFVGNRLHLVSGNIVSGGAPDTQVSTASHDVLEVPEK
ncbi:MAG: hypothetical protein A3J28_04175 [Acidobacteria bacterium RIFCSPLOWO2_12_FULL_60_22]|nr:MAG: hypothetical protein A3J28_04175 [Acidobacteria bacterium RIFCSPLOWO2_12_FULL_60_22]